MKQVSSKTNFSFPNDSINSVINIIFLSPSSPKAKTVIQLMSLLSNQAF